MTIRHVLIFDSIDCGTVTQNTICPNRVCGIKYWNPSDTLAGKRGTLDIIQNPLSLSNANAPLRYQNYFSYSSL